MAVVTLQSTVTYGHVGNAAAVPALQVLGHEVWPINTVSFSNHPGHGRWRGRTRSAAELSDLFRGVRALGVLSRCDAVLSGYLGRPSTAKVVADAVRAVRRVNPGSLYVLDPVMGDEGRIYVAPGVPEALQHHLVPLADILTPNVSELGWIVGQRLEGPAALCAAARQLCSRGADHVVVTGHVEGDRIAAYAVTRNAVRRAHAPLLAARFRGAGDLFAALYTGRFLETRETAPALDFAMAGLALVTEETVRLGRDEFALDACLPELADMRR